MEGPERLVRIVIDSQWIRNIGAMGGRLRLVLAEDDADSLVE